MRWKTPDHRSAALASVLGACALLAVIMSAAFVPVGWRIAIAIGDPPTIED